MPCLLQYSDEANIYATDPVIIESGYDLPAMRNPPRRLELCSFGRHATYLLEHFPFPIQQKGSSQSSSVSHTVSIEIAVEVAGERAKGRRRDSKKTKISRSGSTAFGAHQQIR